MGMQENTAAIAQALRVITGAIDKGFDSEKGPVQVRTLVYGPKGARKTVVLTDENVVLFELGTLHGGDNVLAMHASSYVSYGWMDAFLDMVKRAEAFTAEVHRLERLRETKIMITSTTLVEKLRKIIKVEG